MKREDEYISYEDLNKEQKEAADDILNWYKYDDKQVYALGGYAGTGKSTLVRTVSNLIQDDVGFESRIKYVTYTGKASLVLKRKGLPATTIHSLAYIPEGEKKLDSGKIVPVFKRREKLPENITLLVIDEISMVPECKFKDLKEYGVKILAVGDPGQLPPVNDERDKGNPNEIIKNKKWDSVLKHVHRQAKDNPIIQLASLIRKGDLMRGGIYKDKEGDTRVLVESYKNINKKILKKADQIILGYNSTRRYINKKMREWLGFTDELPEKGDKLICLLNNWNKECSGYVKGTVKEQKVNLVNGMIGYCKNPIRDLHKHYGEFRADFQPEFIKGGYFSNLLISTSPFEGRQDRSSYIYGRDEMVNQFDYGYSITCHKGQGSQWENIAILNQHIPSYDSKKHRRWLYTAVTRASKNLVLFTNTLGYGKRGYIKWENYI